MQSDITLCYIFTIRIRIDSVEGGAGGSFQKRTMYKGGKGYVLKTLFWKFVHFYRIIDEPIQTI